MENSPERKASKPDVNALVEVITKGWRWVRYRLTIVPCIVVLIVLAEFLMVLCCRVSFQPAIMFFFQICNWELANQDIIFFIKQHMDLLATVTWTQMAILGAFVVYFLGSVKEYRYGIPIRKIISYFYGSFFIPILTVFAVFSVLMMTASYYVKDYVRFYDFSIMAIALQLGVMVCVSVLLSDNLIKRIILSMERERFGELIADAEMVSFHDMIGKNQPLVSSVFKGTDLLEERMAMIMELEKIDVEEFRKTKDYDKTKAFLYFRQSFDALNRMIFLKDEITRNDAFRYYASIAVTNYNTNAGYLGNWDWLSAMWISLIECESEKNWKTIQQILETIEGENGEIFCDCLRIVLMGTYFLWYCQKLDEKRAIEGIEQILRFQSENGNRQLVRNACVLDKREEVLLNEYLRLWKNSYGEWTIDSEAWYHLVTALRAKSFFDCAFAFRLNALILPYISENE